MYRWNGIKGNKIKVYMYYNGLHYDIQLQFYVQPKFLFD